MYGLLCEAPDADRVRTPSELSTHMPNLGESDILGHDITNLIHGSTPAEPAVEMVEYLDSVRSFIFLEVNPHLFAESLCPRHQATTVGVARLARSLSCRPCQLEGLTLTCATRCGMGFQESWSETTPVALTSVWSSDPRVVTFVLRRVASETTLHGSGRFL